MLSLFVEKIEFLLKRKRNTSSKLTIQLFLCFVIDALKVNQIKLICEITIIIIELTKNLTFQQLKWRTLGL
jgi:hypothetical protein